MYRLLQHTKKPGFTLVEILIVVAVVGLLSAIILVSVNEARKNARDKQRMTDLKQMELALELYKEAHGEYPKPSTGCYVAGQWHGWAGQPSGWTAGWYEDCDKGAGESWAENLAPTFIAKLPEMQHRTWNPQGYQYRVSDDGDSYKLWIYHGFETLTIDSYDHEFARCPASCGGSGGCALTHVDFPHSPTIQSGPDSTCW